MTDRPSDAPPPPEPSLPALAGRGAVGGVLMGLANLVPGISGGTMLLAAGVYPRFIQGIAEVTTLRFRPASLAVLGSVVGAAGLTIALLAGPVRDLVVQHRWIMYSLFIGLTLGGLPVVWGLVRERGRALWFGAVAGFAGMAALGLAQATGAGTAGLGGSGFLPLFLGGTAGAAAMILPGVSGGYLLLVLGQYVPILSGIDAFKEALRAGDLAAATGPLLGVILPVGLGVVVGVVVVSNALERLLRRHETATLGVLLGLLVGAVVGLWPFQRGVAPAIGSTFKGRVVTPEVLADIPPEKWPTEFFSPTAGQVAGALGLVVVGFALTALVARLGREEA